MSTEGATAAQAGVPDAAVTVTLGRVGRILWIAIEGKRKEVKQGERIIRGRPKISRKILLEKIAIMGKHHFSVGFRSISCHDECVTF